MMRKLPLICAVAAALLFPIAPAFAGHGHGHGHGHGTVTDMATGMDTVTRTTDMDTTTTTDMDMRTGMATDTVMVAAGGMIAGTPGAAIVGC